MYQIKIIIICTIFSMISGLILSSQTISDLPKLTDTLTIEKKAVGNSLLIYSKCPLTKLETNCKYENFPNRVMIYKIFRNRNYSEMLKLFDFEDYKKKTSKQNSIIHFIEKCKKDNLSKAISFIDNSKMFTLDLLKEKKYIEINSDIISSPSKLKMISEDFLNKYNLLPEHYKIFEFKRKILTNNGLIDGYAIKLIPLINGLPLFRGGITLKFHADGSLRWLCYHNRDFTPYKKYPIKSINKVLRNYKKGVYSGSKIKGIGIIDRIALVYLSPIVGVESDYLLPYYVIYGKVKSRKFTIYINAIEDDYIIKH